MIDTGTAEEAVISAMLCFPNCIPAVTEIIAEDNLYKEDLRAIYQAIIQHQQGGLPIEIPALAVTISKHRTAAVQTMVELLDIATTGETATWYARKVLFASIARQITGLAIELQHHPDRAEEIITKIQVLQQPVANIEIRSCFLSASNFLNDSTVVTYLILRMIEQDTTGLLFGSSGAGKTFIATDIACAVCTGGITLKNHRSNEGLVLYLAGEGHRGLRRRVQAWQKNNNKAVEDLALLYLSRHSISFSSPDIRGVIAEGKQLVEQHNKPLALIVIDTLARHLNGDENNAKDMGEFVKAVDSLRSAFPGSVAMIVHHTGHGEDARSRARGSSALKGAMDFEILCDRGLLTFTKMKDGEAPAPIEFKLIPVQIGSDEDGEPVTSCIVEYGARSAKNRDVELTVNERTLLGLVNDYPNILIGDLRSVFYDKRREREPDAKTNTLKNAFLRAYQGLIDKKAILEIDNAVVLSAANPSHVIKPSQSYNMTGESDRHNRHTPLKGCDVVTDPLTSHYFIDLDGGGAAHAN